MTSLRWKRSCTSNGSCLEMSSTEDRVYLRSTVGGPMVEVSHAEWAAFIAGVKAGEFG